MHRPGTGSGSRLSCRHKTTDLKILQNEMHINRNYPKFLDKTRERQQNKEEGTKIGTRQGCIR